MFGCQHGWNLDPQCTWQVFKNLSGILCFFKTRSAEVNIFIESLAHHRNVAGLNLFYRYYFGRCSSELAHLIPLPFSRGRSTSYSDRLHNFPVTIPRCYKDVYANSFLPCTARLWNSLPIECFPLTYDFSGFKSRINRHEKNNQKLHFDGKLIMQDLKTLWTNISISLTWDHFQSDLRWKRLKY